MVYHVANVGWISYYDFVSKIKDFMDTDNIIYRAKDKDLLEGAINRSEQL